MIKRIILLMMLLVGVASFAQDTKWKFSVLGGVNLEGGNNPQHGGNIKTDFSWENKMWEFAINPSFTMNYATVDEVTKLVRREAYSTMTLSYKLDNGFKLIAFSEADHSYMRKINIRYSGGFGPGYKIGNENWEIGLSEVILAEGLNTQNKTYNDYLVLRSSTRVKLRLKTGTSSITSVNFIQPAIYTSQDIPLNNYFIFRTQDKFEVAISKTLSLGVSCDANYESFPSYINSSVVPFDWSTNFFVSYKIGK